MNVSIIIPTHNRSELLSVCLNKLIKQITSNDEIIVADNMSTDNTKKVVTSLIRSHPIKYVFTTQGGASGARNTAFSIATKPCITFIDDDSLVHNGWLRNVKDTLKRYKNTNPKPVFQGKINQHYSHKGLYELIRTDEFNRTLDSLGMGKSSKEGVSLKTIVVCNIFSYKSVFQKVKGPFNSDIFPFMGEDPDIASRFIAKGVPILYAPKAVITHSKSKVTLKITLRAAYAYGRAKAILEKAYLNNPNLIFALNTGKSLEKSDQNIVLPTTKRLKRIIKSNLSALLSYHLYLVTCSVVYNFSYKYNLLFFSLSQKNFL